MEDQYTKAKSFCPLKGKKTPKLAIADPIGSHSSKPTSGTMDSSKVGSGKHEVLQSSLQAALKRKVPFYRTEEMVVDLSKLKDDPKMKIEKKKHDRKRKTEKDLVTLGDEEELHGF